VQSDCRWGKIILGIVKHAFLLIYELYQTSLGIRVIQFAYEDCSSWLLLQFLTNATKFPTHQNSVCIAKFKQQQLPMDPIDYPHGQTDKFSVLEPYLCEAVFLGKVFRKNSMLG
jgi:hypothetical protein